MRAHIANPDAPLLLEGGTGIGKTRAYLAPIFDAAAAGKRIAIVLYSHALIDQLLASGDLSTMYRAGVSVQAFRPASFFPDRPSYEANRAVATAADIMVCTSASVIIDQRLKGRYNSVTTDRAYILFDEADELPASAALQSDLTIEKAAQVIAGAKAGSTLKDTLEAVATSREVIAEDRARAKLCLKALANPAWFWTVGYDEDGAIVLYHRLPGRLLKKVANRPSVAFVSATLSIGGTFDDFRRSLGIAKQSVLSSIVEPAKHGDVSFVVNEEHLVDTAEWFDRVIDCINEAEGPVLVVPGSFELAETIGGRLIDAVVRQRGETAAQAVARMGDARVLVAAGAWAGLDTSKAWKSVVVPRVPFKRPIILDGAVESRYFDARNTAIRRLRQVLGRGLRQPTASMTFYLLDPRFEIQRMSAFVPQRFQAAWAGRAGGKAFPEGSSKRVELTQFERDPRVRAAALKHHGCRCQACGLEAMTPEDVSALLEVHHLVPIATSGQRRTNVATDTAVLCRNCHGLTHQTDPPRSIEELRSGGRPAAAATDKSTLAV